MSRPDLIVFSHLRWDWVWQRPQHIVSRIGRNGRTWFVEEPRATGVTRPVLRTEGAGTVTRVWLEVPGDAAHLYFGDAGTESYLEELRGLFGDIKDPCVWLYSPLALELAQAMNPEILVYDVMDDLAAFKYASDTMVLRQHQAIAAADVVFAGGRSLYENVLRQDPKEAHLFPSGVEPEHYAVAREMTVDNQRPVAGYVGVIDERIDLGLLSELAARLPDWEIRLVGPVIKLEDAKLPDAPNITYLGQQPYERLPELMGAFDVALMPFALNASTRSISPTKTLEYLAAGLPVVSTRVPDVVTDFSNLVDLQEDAAGFASACEEVRSHPLDERDRKFSAVLKMLHWDAIAQRMDEIVARVAGRSTRRTRRRAIQFDFIVAGAGFAGSVVAERLAADAGKKVLVVEKRSHIGGNAHDHYDEHGILVHRYGPHIFHTNSSDVFAYLSRFTEWRRYEHRVLASVDGRLVPIPINLDTINELFGLSLNALEMKGFLASLAEPVEHCTTSEDVVVSAVGRDLYEKFFRNYTRKQWGLDPSELDASVTARVPTRTNRDPRYFCDKYQAMPKHGYTAMFERMLDHPNIKVLLNTSYQEIADLFPEAQLVYTGPIDEYFDFRFGELPYRSLRFEFETVDVPVAQPAPVINYPNEHEYTRQTEFKYLTGQEHAKSTVVREYPTAKGDPYYPIPRPENATRYKKYKRLAQAETGVHFVGRLATYKYYNMDQVVAQALQTYARIKKAASPATRGVATITPGDGELAATETA